MKIISVANDIVPIGKFKTGISKWFENIRRTGHPLVITQNGKPAGVLLSPAEYDELVYRKAFMDSVGRGLTDADAGRVMNSAVLLEELDERRSRE
jgi:antitoxin YefM